MTEVGVIVAFAAGIASFLSPCVLPLVPGYLSSISGLSLEELRAANARTRLASRATLNSLVFGAGFTLVFVALGASATVVGKLLFSNLSILARVAGIWVIVFGLYTSGLVPVRFFDRERRFHPIMRSAGPLASLLLGAAFAFGWTPCLGPILGAILTYASVQTTVSQGVLLLVVYSLGLGVPFLLTAMGIDVFLRFFARVQQHFRTIRLVSGLLLVAIGLLILTDNLQRLAYLGAAG